MNATAFELKIDAMALRAELKRQGFRVSLEKISHAEKELYLVKWS